MVDWRLPENRWEAFQRFYGFHLRYRSHPGMVYSFLPAIAKAYDLDDDGKAWLTWLNGNTQNAVTSLLLLEAAPRAADWRRAVDFWNENFKLLEWDTDRRHQKSKFGVATEEWYQDFGSAPAEDWLRAGYFGWNTAWAYSKSQPYMGRLSAWSMYEYARILLGPSIPDIGSWMLEDVSGSHSHRNGIAFVIGYDSVYWEPDLPRKMGIVPELNFYADALMDEAAQRWQHRDVSRLTMESALCTYKSWHKPNRRYPNVYADMMYNRIKKAEARFGRTFDLLWETRRHDLPEYLRLEDCPTDPGLSAEKQNHYLETGCPVMMHRDYPDDMDDGFMAAGQRPLRKDPSWK